MLPGQIRLTLQIADLSELPDALECCEGPLSLRMTTPGVFVGVAKLLVPRQGVCD